MLVGVSPSCMPASPRPRPARVVGDRGEHQGPGRRRVGLDDRLAGVAALAQRRVERHLAEHGHVVPEPLRQRRRHPLAAAGAEDLEPVLDALLLAVRAGQVAHVLEDADDPLVHHRGHRAGALGHLGGGLLRGGHHDHLGAGQVLPEGDRDVAGAGRQVEQQHVEVAPVDVREHLHQGPVEHRPAPGDHLVATGLEHADRDDRDRPLGVGTGMIRSSTWVGRRVGDAEHRRHRVAVDVGVHDADLHALLGHRQREVDGHRGLADAALPAGDREHLGERAGLGERDLPLRLAVAQPILETGPLLGGHHTEMQVDASDPGNRADGRRDVLGDGVLQWAAGDGEQHGHVDQAGVIDLDRVHHSEVGDRSLDLRVVDRGQRCVHLVEEGRAHDVRV